MAIDVLKAVNLSHNACLVMAIRVAHSAGVTVEEMAEELKESMTADEIRDFIPVAEEQEPLPF